MPNTNLANPYGLHAACRVAAAGNFVANSEPFGITSAGAPAASVYLITFPNNNLIDLNDVCELVSCALLDRAAIVLHASDSTTNVTTFTASTGAATDAIFNFADFRTAIGTG